MAILLYSIANDTANGKVEGRKLHDDIVALGLSVTLTSVETGDDNLTINFVEASIPPADEAEVDAAVAVHGGEKAAETTTALFDDNANILLERLDDDGIHTGLVALAPHGGALENWTDDQAERVASQLAAKGVSSWRCKGWRSGGGAFDRWHITSTEISRRSFPLLDSIGSRGFQYAVAFHGFTDSEILIGGGASQSLKERVRDAIAAVVVPSIPVRVATAEDEFGGDNPDNLTNWITSGGTGGVQIDQSYQARQDHWQEIADAVASVFDALI